MCADKSRSGAVTTGGGCSRTGGRSRSGESSHTNVPSREEGWCCDFAYISDYHY